MLWKTSVSLHNLLFLYLPLFICKEKFLFGTIAAAGNSMGNTVYLNCPRLIWILDDDIPSLSNRHSLKSQS